MEDDKESINILGVSVDKVSIDQAIELVEKWLRGSSKHYIVTPNVEFVMAAQEDEEFKKILNRADLRIPDSGRFGIVERILKEKSRLKKLLLIPFVIFPKLINNFPVTTGIDLMDKLCQKAADQGFTIGLLGGKNRVAEKTAECLLKRYPKLKIGLVEDGPLIDSDGNMKDEKWKIDTKDGDLTVDVLFVAFGQVKQEKWISQNLPKLPIKVMMGVGGAFDYLSGQIPRAPVWMRIYGLEWLFRLIIQPWRLKRQLNLLKFIYLLLI